MDNIYQVDSTDGTRMAQLLPFGAARWVVAVAYDPVAKLIYWTDGGLRTINKYSLMTNSSTVIYKSNDGKQYTGVANYCICLTAGCRPNHRS